MPVEDLRDREPGSRLVADVCIVGSGPAGATIALELAATGVAICLVESGGAEPDPAVDDLSEIESVGMHRAPQAVTRARVLGGTSSLWTGRCGVTCTDGSTLAHRYEDGVEGSLLATTSLGGFRDDAVVVVEDGQRQEVAVERIETDGGDLRSLVARLPQAEVRWHNPFAGHGFTDEQVAVASVLVDFAGAVRRGGEPAYLAEDSLLDMELLTAMRYSAAEGGRTITLPVSSLDRLRSKVVPRLKRG